VAARGAEEMARLVATSVPFVRFRVERELARAELSSGEGKDKAIDALRPVFAEIPPSAMREELLALVADRVDIQPALVASWLAQPARAAAATVPSPAPGAAGAPQPPRPAPRLDPAARAERAFLMQCLALPDAGRDALAAVREEDFTSELHRRALRHLRTHIDAPTEGVPEGDEELRTLIAELSVRAGREHSSLAALKGETLKLELARLERQIAAARARGGAEITALKEREREVHALLDRAIETVVAETHVPADA
jgi:DNA primase